jgi:hypothetical protein
MSVKKGEKVYIYGRCGTYGVLEGVATKDFACRFYIPKLDITLSTSKFRIDKKEAINEAKRIIATRVKSLTKTAEKLKKINLEKYL